MYNYEHYRIVVDFSFLFSLTEKIMKNSDLEKPGILFVTSVTNLLDRLLDYRFYIFCFTYMQKIVFKENTFHMIWLFALFYKFCTTFLFRKVISMHEECREMKMGCIVNLLVCSTLISCCFSTQIIHFLFLFVWCLKNKFCFLYCCLLIFTLLICHLSLRHYKR